MLTDFNMMVKAVIFMLIVQQIDGNILYPRIVGGVMSASITIMVLLLLSSNIYGVIGMIIGDSSFIRLVKKSLNSWWPCES